MDTSITIAVVLVVGLIVVLLFGWWRAATRTGRGNRRRQRVAMKAEGAAEALLARQGYTVLSRQVVGEWEFQVDGEWVSVTCRADLLVERSGRRHIAEVKSSPRVASPTCPATRRQLLEYQLAFDVDGVLLVDMAARRICRIVFPMTRFP